jgi:hypothetical protein
MIRFLKTHKAALFVVLLILAALVYLPGLHGGFVYDDWGSIGGNAKVQVKDGTAAEWFASMLSFPSGTPPFRSLTMLTFAVNYYFDGLNPAAFKLTNIALHLINGCLLFLALRALFALRRACANGRNLGFDGTLAAAAIAGLWLLLPINLTAVLYVVQRLESLAATFTFLGLWWYLHARLRLWEGRGGVFGLWASVIVCTGAGLLAKETAITLPLYACMIEICITGGRDRGGRFSRPVLALYACTLVVPFVVGVFWLWGRYLGSHLLSADTIDRLLTEARVLIEYIHWTLVPSLDDLTLYHDDIVRSHGLLDPPATLLSILALAALLGAALWQRKRRPLFALGVAWWFTGHLLTATVIPLMLAFEHRNYFPSAGLLLAAASLLALESPLRTSLRPLLFGAATVFYAGTTLLRAEEWSDPLRLSASDAMKRPASSNAQYDYAQALIGSANQSSDPSKQLNAALQVLDKGRRLPDAGIHFEQSMITLLAHAGYEAPTELWRSIADKLRREPPDTNGIHALSRLNHCFSDKECKDDDRPKLAEAYDAALSHKPIPQGLYAIHAEYAWHVADDRPQAERDFRAALALAPNDIEAKMNLIVVLIYEGKRDEATAMIEALERRNRFGMLDGFIGPLRRTLDSVSARAQTSQ